MDKERFELFGEHCIKDNSLDARPQLIDTYVSCVILNEQDKRIKELQRCLAKSEEEKQMWQQMYKSADKINKNICETDIYPLQEENQQLKERLSLKMDELHVAYCGIEAVKTKNGELKAEIKTLKQSQKQLAIEELEKALVLIQNAVNLESPEYDLVGLYDAIVDQIKSLKGEEQ